MKISRLLLATDLSDDALAAVRYVRRTLAESTDYVTVLTVVEPIVLPEWPYVPSGDFENQLVENSRTRLHDLVTENLSGLQVEEKVILSTNVAQVISDTAGECGAELIVLASHGAGALANLFIGSTVQRVIKLAACPVLVIPKGAA